MASRLPSERITMSSTTNKSSPMKTCSLQKEIVANSSKSNKKSSKNSSLNQESKIDIDFWWEICPLKFFSDFSGIPFYGTGVLSTAKKSSPMKSCSFPKEKEDEKAKLSARTNKKYMAAVLFKWYT